jgi:hypothetical protein
MSTNPLPVQFSKALIKYFPVNTRAQLPFTDMDGVSTGIGFAASLIAVATLAMAVASTIDDLKVSFREAQDTLNEVRRQCGRVLFHHPEYLFRQPRLRSEQETAVSANSGEQQIYP